MHNDAYVLAITESMALMADHEMCVCVIRPRGTEAVLQNVVDIMRRLPLRV